MRVELHENAREELQDFPEGVKQELKSRLAELEAQPTGHEHAGRIEVKSRPVFKYVMKKGNRGSRIDNRAVYDIQNGKIIVYAIFHRDKGYRKDDTARRF